MSVSDRKEGDVDGEGATMAVDRGRRLEDAGAPTPVLVSHPLTAAPRALPPSPMTRGDHILNDEPIVRFTGLP